MNVRTPTQSFAGGPLAGVSFAGVSLAGILALGLAVAVAALTAGCGDEIAEPYELGHPRLLAIRTEPAVIPPSRGAGAGGDGVSEGKLDALFTDGETPPRLAEADELTVELAEELLSGLGELARAQLRGLIERRADGWHVRAPDEAALQAARVALGVPEGAPVALPLEVTVEPASAELPGSQVGPLRAQKLVSFGTFVGNPEPPELVIGEQPVATRVAIPRGAEVTLRAALPPAALAGPPDDATYRWFASFGEVRHYTQPLALISAESGDGGSEGGILVVARTAAGGVSWKFVAAEVTD